MTTPRLKRLRLLSLFFLLPGLAGLIFAAAVSTHYLETLPRDPVPQDMRMVPRNIHGTVVYQTEDEDRRLDTIEYSSVTVFLIGLSLGLIYLRQWGLSAALSDEEPEPVEQIR